MSRLLSNCFTQINTLHVQCVPFAFSCKRNPQKVLYLATFLTFLSLFSTTFSAKSNTNLPRFRIKKFSVIFRPTVRIFQPQKRQKLGLVYYELIVLITKFEGHGTSLDKAESWLLECQIFEVLLCMYTVHITFLGNLFGFPRT